MIYGLALSFAFLAVGLMFGAMMTGGWDTVVETLRVVVGGSLLLSLAHAYYFRRSGTRRVRLIRWAAVLVIPIFVHFTGITAINHFGCIGGFFCSHDL